MPARSIPSWTGLDRQICAASPRACRAISTRRAALSLPWSNSPAKGQVNRLKLLKRQMYGRAKFDLLRSRVLHAAYSKQRQDAGTSSYPTAPETRIDQNSTPIHTCYAT